MKIVTLNVNGIRATHRKGFFAWMQTYKPDIVCLQEVRADLDQMNDEMQAPTGYFAYFNIAQQKKGYSGVALYARKRPDRIYRKLGWRHADEEGRFIRADFGPLSVISLYMPSGSSSDKRQAIKFDFMDRLLPILQHMGKCSRQYVLCGDWNIAHQKIDLKNWRSNQKNSGFLPEERRWMDQVFECGLIDAFRQLNQQADQYTWWSNRGQARVNNVGWRLDYQVVSKGLREYLTTTQIYTRQNFSDHAPLIVEYNWPF